MTTPDPRPEQPPAQQLDRSLISGLAWIGAMRTVTQAIQWAAALIVVRLLTPTDYGLVGMATAYLGLVRLLSEFGLGAAVIQHRELSEDQVARISGFSVLFASGFAALSIAVSPLVASFFGEVAVRNIVIVLSTTFVFAGLDVVPRSLLKRDLKFRTLALVQASENLTFAVTSLTLAALGAGYWSLVLSAVAASFVRLVASYLARAHRIAWPRRLDSISDELWFGWHVVLSRLGIYVRRFADITIVGRILGTQALGLYNVARMMATLVVERVNDLIAEVTPSVLAAAKHDNASLRRYLRMVTEGVALLSFPATLGMAVVADDFVLLVFGERWAPAITPMRFLAVAGALRSLTPILSQVLIAKERAKLNMQFTWTSAIVIPSLLIVGTRWGITGVGAAWLIGHPLVMLPTALRSTLKAVEMPLRDYLAALRPAAVAAVFTVLVVLGVRAVMPGHWPLPVRFGIEVGAGAATYGIGIMAFYRERMKAFVALLKSARGKPRPQAEGQQQPLGDTE